MKKSNQIAWNVFSIISFIVSGIMIYLGYDKKTNYFSSTISSSLTKNAYVGGDAYNYIINSSYSTGYYVLALLFVVIGIGFIIASYLDKLVTIQENSTLKKNKAEEKNILSDENFKM